MAKAGPQTPPPTAPFHRWLSPDGTVWTVFYRAAAGYLLRFPGLADFHISRDGRRIRCRPAPGVGASTVSHLYQNQVLPLALGRQGKLVFHASAVEIGDGAAAFAGASGLGKSTLAASFAGEGFRFLSDDGLALEPEGGGYLALPSHPSIRLWEDSLAALACDGAPQAPPLPFTSKARLLAGGGVAFCGQPRRLRRMYFLGQGEAPEPTIKRLGPGEALIELLKHSFLLDIEERRALAEHFEGLAGLAALPIFHRLDYPRHYQGLPAVRRAIVRHTEA